MRIPLAVMPDLIRHPCATIRRAPGVEVRTWTPDQVRGDGIWGVGR